MEDYIQKSVFKEERSKGHKKNRVIEVHVLKADEDEEKFIIDKITTINSLGSGTFRKTNSATPKDRETGYFLFSCTRSGKSKPRSNTAAGCKAYISFKLKTDWINYKVIIQRTFNDHSGHDPNAKTEGHCQTICPELISRIQCWLSLGVKSDTILLQAHKWSKEQGHNDVNQRAYFVTPRDIDNIRTCMMRRHHLDKDDAWSTAKLLEGPLKDCVVFYQAFSPQTELIIVLQTPLMKKSLDDYGMDIVFMDATHCVNQYGFPLYTLAVRDSHGHGVPVAHIILSNEKQVTLELALEKLKPVFKEAPRCFMVDKDMTEINALQKVFQESDVLLCWYHVTQAVVRWLKRTESGVSGSDDTEIREHIIQFFTKMKSCATRDEYEERTQMFLQQFCDFPSVCKYFQTYWEKIGSLWADFGRCYNHGESDTNNLIERFFHRLKYQMMCGIKNRRLDNLIEILLNKTNDYFTITQDLQAVGRVMNPLDIKFDAVLESANRMLKKGCGDKVELRSGDSPYKYCVPSEQTENIVYSVCPAEQYCTCAVGVRGCMCKHQLLIKLLNNQDSVMFPDLATQIQAHASSLIQRQKYTVVCQDTKTVHVESMCGRGLFKPCIVNSLCNCCTFSYHRQCACLLVANELFKATDTNNHVIDHTPHLLPSKVDLQNGVTHQMDGSSIEKLKHILQTLEKWENIPESIALQICVLHNNVTKESAHVITFQKGPNNDHKRKIRALHPKRDNKLKRKLCTDERACKLTKFPKKSKWKRHVKTKMRCNSKVQVTKKN